MARARNIKPGFFTNEELVELPFETRLLFIGLWTIADRAGRLEDRPKRIKMAIFPADSVDVDACLNELQASGFLIRYEHGGERYIQVLAFNKHQNPHKDEKASTIPAPCSHGASTVQEQNSHGGNPADSLIPDSLQPDSGLIDSAPESVAPKFDAKADLIAEGVGAQTVADWLALRKAKKAPVSKTALDAIKREVATAGMALDSALALCCERGWAGFKAEWVLPKPQARASPPLYESAKDRSRREASENLTGRRQHEQRHDIIDI